MCKRIVICQSGGAAAGYSMRDIHTLRTFLTGHTVFAFFDAPWAPFYILLIFLFHPLFGVIISARNGRSLGKNS